VIKLASKFLCKRMRRQAREKSDSDSPRMVVVDVPGDVLVGVEVGLGFTAALGRISGRELVLG